MPSLRRSRRVEAIPPDARRLASGNPPHRNGFALLVHRNTRVACGATVVRVVDRFARLPTATADVPSRPDSIAGRARLPPHHQRVAKTVDPDSRRSGRAGAIVHSFRVTPLTAFLCQETRPHSVVRRTRARSGVTLLPRHRGLARKIRREVVVDHVTHARRGDRAGDTPGRFIQRGVAIQTGRSANIG